MPSLEEEADQLLADFQDTTPSTNYLLNEKRISALKGSDHGSLSSMDDQVVKDSDPLYTMISDQGQNAFNLIKDEQGRDCYICGTEHAAVWVLANDTTSEKKASLEIGVMSANGGQASSTLLDKLGDNADHIALGAIATGIGAVVGKQITAALTRRAAEAAEIVAAGIARDDAYKVLSAARKSGNSQRLSDAIKKLKDARGTVDKLWMKNIPKGAVGEKIMKLATRYPKLSGFLGGTIVTIVLTIAFEVLWYFINKDLYISARIYNWDTRPWEIDDWYHDNGILVGNVAFEKKTIAAAVKAQTTPWGNRLGKWKSAKFVEYSFQNSFTVLDGIGIGLRARSVDGKNGLAMGYLCSFTKANQLTVKDAYPTSIKDFYWDNKNWPSDRPLKTECETTGAEGGKIKVTASTNALNGAKDNKYDYLVNIGDPGRDV